MLITADWVLPISHRPIRDGAVLIDGGRVVAVGPLGELEAAAPAGTERRDFPGCVMMPGLVNAHTHLTLTALAGVVEPMPFTEWLPRLVAALKPWDIADHEASGAIGAEQSLLAGVTVVGDIAYGPAEVAAASLAGLGGVYYWEVLGVEAEQLPAELDRLSFPAEPDSAFGPRVRCGLSPHSVYTSGPGLLRAVRDTSVRLGVPYAIHVAESAAETRLLHDGSGPLAATAGRVARGFVPPGTGAVTYLHRLGALDGATAVHLGEAHPAEIPLLAANVRGVVACPRSNRYLRNATPPVGRFLDQGIAVGVGTDSSASNDDLDLMAEVRAIHLSEPDLTASKLLEMATRAGASAIGVEDRFGALEPGLQADLAIFSLGATDEPEAAVLASAGRDTIEAVMTAGTWRVLGGKLLSQDPASRVRAGLAAEKSIAALAERDG